MKFVTGIAFCLFAASALAGCGQHTGDYGAFGSAHQMASDARPVYRDPIHNRDNCHSQQFPACGDN